MFSEKVPDTFIFSGKEKGKHGPDPTLDEIQRIIDDEIRPL